MYWVHNLSLLLFLHHSRSWEKLRLGKLWSGFEMFWSRRIHVGGTKLPSHTRMATLGIRLLPLQLQRWSPTYLCRQLQLYLLLSGTKVVHKHLSQWLATPWCSNLPLVRGNVWRIFWGTRWGVSPARRSSAFKQISQRLFTMWSRGTTFSALWRRLPQANIFSNCYHTRTCNKDEAVDS